jgi:uncharacterized protein YndB with AHSA1/START domain
MNELPGRPQGRDSILIERAPELVWPQIADSTLLPHWGPPVQRVELLDPLIQGEGAGSRRRVDAKFGGRTGTFEERRIIHEPPRRMAFVIEAETFGLFRFLQNVGSLIELQSAGPDRTLVTWTFFHDTRGWTGSVANGFVILRQQRANRLRALASLKAWVEEGRERPTP